eukprot:180441_1
MALLFLVILSLCWIISFSAKPTNPPTTFPSLFPTQLTSSPTAPSTAPTPLPSASPVTLGPTPPTIAGFPYDGWTEHLSPSFPRELAHNAIGIDPSNNTIWLLGERYDRSSKQLVAYNYITNNITDYGADRLETNVFGETHYYAQIGSVLYIGNEASAYLDTFDVTTTTFVANSISPPLKCSFAYSCLVSIRDQYLALLQNDGIVQILDTHSQQWLSNVSDLIVGRAVSSCAYLNDKMYNIGGFNNNAGGGQSSIEILDVSPTAMMNIQSVSWMNNSEPMPFAIQDARSITIHNAVLVIGGYDRDSHTYLDTIYAIDGTNGSVSLVGHLNKTVVDFALIVADNVLYSFGGKHMNNWEEGWSHWQTKSIDIGTMNPTIATKSPTDLPSMPTLAPSSPTSQPFDVHTVAPNPARQPTIPPSDIPTMDPSKSPSKPPTQTVFESHVTTDTSNTNDIEETKQDHVSIIYVALGALSCIVATVFYFKYRDRNVKEIGNRKETQDPEFLNVVDYDRVDEVPPGVVQENSEGDSDSGNSESMYVNEDIEEMQIVAEMVDVVEESSDHDHKETRGDVYYDEYLQSVYDQKNIAVRDETTTKEDAGSNVEENRRREGSTLELDIVPTVEGM